MLTLLISFVTVARIMAKPPPKIHEDTLDSLLDRIGILREDLISIERSLERIKAAQKTGKGSARLAT